MTRRSPRRRSDFGAVTRLPSGKWRAQYRAPDGSRPSRVFNTRADATAWLTLQRGDVLRGGWVNPKAGRVTLDVWSEHWLTRPDLRPKTRELYEGLLCRHVLPAFGKTELAQLSPARVRAWHAALAGPGGPGPSTAAKAYRLLRAMLNTAVHDEVIVKNPCQVKGAGIEHAPERPVASFAEVEALAEAMPEQWSLLVLLAAWCGLRRGELLGLHRGDVDELHARLRVDSTHAHLDDGSVVKGPPKTDAGRRKVAIPPHVVPAVRFHLERFVGPESGALVFTGVKGGPLRPHVLQTAWNRARATVGRTDLHLHDLRHSGNTWAAATGASTKELMARLGHASAAAALRYQHATEDRDAVLAEALSALVKPAPVQRIEAVSEAADSPVTHGRLTTRKRTSRKGARKRADLHS